MGKKKVYTAVVRDIPEGTEVYTKAHTDIFIGEMRKLVGQIIKVKRAYNSPTWFDGEGRWTYHKSWLNFKKEDK